MSGIIVHRGSGANGGVTIAEVEVDFGSVPVWSKVLTVIDATITTASKIIAVQSGKAASGREADENEMDPILFSATPQSGQMLLIANPQAGPVGGSYKVNYIVG